MRILLTIIVFFISSFAFGQKGSITILFTGDLHSCAHRYPALASVIGEERRKVEQSGGSLLVLDAGDIAMGSIFHSVMPSEAIEYRALARMGYDAFSYGNHDFDFGEEAFAGMFTAAWRREPLLDYPELVCANLTAPKVTGTFREHGKDIPKYMMFQRGNHKVGVIGLFGENAYEVTARDKEKIRFSSPVEAAKKLVPQMKREGADYIVVISHGGTLNKEDLTLAGKVDGIDLIISGHDHDLLPVPKIVNGASIVAAGSNGDFVGKVVLQDGKISGYKMIEVDSASRDEAMGRWVDSMKLVVDNYFYKTVGVNPGDTVATIPYALPRVVDESGNMKLGEFIAAGYRKAAIENLNIKDESSVIGVAPYGTVRRGLESGMATYNDIFDILPLGENEDGYTGYPLVYSWLTGDEICDLCELNASFAQYLEDARLFFSGVEWSVGKWRIPLFKVKEVKVNGAPVVKDKLYMVVTCKYTADMIGLLKSASYGLLSAKLKDASGNPVEPEQIPVLRSPQGDIIVQWKAFADYLKSHTLSL